VNRLFKLFQFILANLKIYLCKPMRRIPLLISSLLLILITTSYGQKKGKSRDDGSLIFDTKLFDGMEWRCVGPFRGGRSAAVTGVAGKRNLFYFGSTGGGVWKSENGGQSWENISDGYFGGSIGAVAVSDSDPNVIYVGGGEKTLRGNVSYGYGVWKSQDAGKTWKSAGLAKSRHISRIRIHPWNSDIVYAAVIGDIYQPSDTRGIYRSRDGGSTWERILFSNDEAGAVDLILDPTNPRIMYASTWRVKRTPYSFESGGQGSALWKSSDGGDSWTNLSQNKGLPNGIVGIIGIAVSPVKPDRIFAIIEALGGGVFRSDDGGETWIKTNEDRALRQRAWYYSRIYADPTDQDIVYVMNVSYHRSKDGGRTFESFNAPHGDHHDLWIDPLDPHRMIIGDDGGAQVSFDGGENWSTYYNQPTAQFYRVVTDNHFPYRIYGAQQDNSTVRILHRTEGNSIGERDWEPTAGGESAHIAVDPLNDDIVYGGSYGGFLMRIDHRIDQVRLINVWPDNPMGYGAEGMKFRFQWNFPIFFSPHNPEKLYACSNYLHVSYDEGQSWEVISPDLTTNTPEKLKSSGGPITKDNTGVEYYCTIFAAAESFHEEGVIWTGSDDGLIQITRDGGKNWANVTPSGMPAWAMVNSIEIDPFHPGGVYVAATSYKSGDYRPCLFKTRDYGKTWEKIINGIHVDHFTRVVRADPDREGLLYCGTENGMYISFDDGLNWQAWQLNLPIVPITDLMIKGKNLIAATQGRSFWIIDDLSPLHQLEKKMETEKVVLFDPIPSYRIGGSQNKKNKREGTNHPGGVLVNYYLDFEPDSATQIRLKFLESDGTLIKEFSNRSESDKLEPKKGFNQFSWDMRYPDAKKFEGMILWAASLRGPVALPGSYKIRLIVIEDSLESPFNIIKDPRSQSSEEELKTQFDFLREVSGKISETHEAISSIRNTRTQLDQLKEKIGKSDVYQSIIAQADTLKEKLTRVEEVLYQTKNKSDQDPLNYPIRLNNKLAHLMWLSSVGDYKPTEQALKLKNEMTVEIDEALKELEEILGRDVPAFNQDVLDAGIQPVMIDSWHHPK
jgi:photosystem II stability/assembly factor-like uncharacterized protein